MMRRFFQWAFLHASRVTFFLVILVWLAAFWAGHRWRSPAKVIAEDAIGYYSYVPAVFVYHDISMRYVVGNPFFGDKVWAELKEGGLIQKYTYGMALFYTPFFGLGHLTAWVSGSSMDGYSWPYAFWLQFSGLFYATLGLWLLRKTLRAHFDEIPVALTLLALGLGSNLFYYAAIQAPMAHAVEFFLLTLWFRIIVNFWKTPSIPLAFALGLVGGLMVIVRPSHLPLWIFPVVYGITDGASVKERFRFLVQKIHFPLIWILSMAIVALPQLFYWHFITGQWFYYSYKDEHFFWTEPALIQNWFSFRNGWLIYSPIMAFSLVGIPVLIRKWKELKWAFPITLALATWVITSWWCWWYGGSFGNRPWIDFYGWLALSLAALLSRTWVKKAWTRGLSVFLIGGFILLNLFQSWQLSRDILHFDSMTAQAYFRSIGSLEPAPDLESLLEHPDYEAAKKGR